MNTWTPLWSQVVESTLWEEPLEVRVLFLTMLAIKDPDHVVRMPFRRLCKKANMEPAVVEEALKTLMNPDHRSPEPQEFEGRRVEAVEGGWVILNGEHYRQEMAKLMRRFYKASWARNKRASAKVSSTQSERLREQAAKNNDAGTIAALDRMEGLTPQGKPLVEVFAEEERRKSVPHGTSHRPKSGPESLQPPASSAGETPGPDQGLPESSATASLPAPEPEEEPLGPDGLPLD